MTRRGIDRQSGSAAIVAGVILVALGLLLAGTMAFRDARQSRIELRDTQDRLTAIAEAMVNFARATGRLPCPARGDRSSTHDQEGIEERNAGGTCEATVSGAAGQDVGVVPWRTLGLHRNLEIDKWGRRISYRVFHGLNGLTQDGGIDMSDCDTTQAVPASLAASGLCGNDNTPTQFLAAKGFTFYSTTSQTLPLTQPPTMNPADGTGAAFVLVSHGRTGAGAYLPSGAQMQPPPVSDMEPSNLSESGSYYSATMSDATIGPSADEHFDDVVLARTISEIAEAAGLVAQSYPETCGANEENNADQSACQCLTGYQRNGVGICVPVAPIACPTGATGTPPACTCGGGNSYSPSTNTCVPTPPRCPPTATGSPPGCTCAASGTVYDIGSNTCVVQNNCPSGATGTPPACTCTTGIYNASTNTCSTTCPANSTGTAPNCTCNAGFEMTGGTCQTQPVFTAPGGGGTSSFVPSGITPGSPNTTSYTVATTVNGQPALNLYSPTGALIGTVTADMGVDNTSVNSALTWNATTGLGVSSSGGGGPGGGPNAAMERSEGVVMNFTSYYRSIALAMFDLQGTVTATNTDDVVFLYLFRRDDPTSTDAISETSALRQFALPACSGSNNTYALFSSLMAGQGKLFDVMKVVVQEDSNNNVKNNIYAMSLSGTAGATMTITGALSPCTVWYCDTPNTCGGGGTPWKIYSAASPG